METYEIHYCHKEDYLGHQTNENDCSTQDIRASSRDDVETLFYGQQYGEETFEDVFQIVKIV